MMFLIFLKDTGKQKINTSSFDPRKQHIKNNNYITYLKKVIDKFMVCQKLFRWVDLSN